MAHDSRLGTLHTTVDGRYALRFERILAHPRELVWRAITDADQLAAWFPAVVELSLVVGAPLRFGPTSEQVRRLGLAPKQPIGTGQVVVADPPSRLEFT